MTRIMPTHPYKVAPLYGGGKGGCAEDYDWGYGFKATDGVGSHYGSYSCNGTYNAKNSQGSNLLQYCVDNDWTLELAFGSHDCIQYKTDPTIFQNVKAWFIDVFDDWGVKWCIETSRMCADSMRVSNFRTPPYTNLDIYNPANLGSKYSAITNGIKSYEDAYGPAIDYIEGTLADGGNFQGYTGEVIYHNFTRWLHGRSNYCYTHMTYDGWGGFYSDLYNDHMNSYMNDSGVDVLATSGNSYNKWVHCATIDEVLPEIYRADNVFLNACAAFLPTLHANFPNMPVILNLDAPCDPTVVGWSGTHGAPYGYSTGTPTETGSDIGYWIAAGTGHPNRCAAERTEMINKCTVLKAANGKSFDGMHYNAYTQPFPIADGKPDLTWYMKMYDDYIVPTFIIPAGSSTNASWTETGAGIPHLTAASTKPSVTATSPVLYSASKNITLQAP